MMFLCVLVLLVSVAVFTTHRWVPTFARLYGRLRYSPVVVWHAYSPDGLVRFPEETDVRGEYIEAALVTWNGMPGPAAFCRNQDSYWHKHYEVEGTVPEVVFDTLQGITKKRRQEANHRAIEAYHETLRLRAARLAKLST